MKNFDADQAEVNKLTPETTGATEGAVEAAKRIMMLDGLACVRNACRGSTHDIAAFAAEFARIIDSEIKAARKARKQRYRNAVLQLWAENLNS
jgi:hypothetical protein